MRMILVLTVYLQAKIALPDGTHLEVINTHLDAHREGMRGDQIDELVQKFILVLIH